MDRNDEDRSGIWLALTVIILALYSQGTKPPSSIIWAVGWFVIRELIYLFAPAFQAMSENARDRKRYFDSLPQSQPVPFWWWRKAEHEMYARYNHFAGWFEPGEFSEKALHALFDHFIHNGSEQYLTPPGTEAVCLEWSEYTKEQLREKFICLLEAIVPDDAAISPDENFQKILEQLRLHTALYALEHEAESGEIFYTYLVRIF